MNTKLELAKQNYYGFNSENNQNLFWEVSRPPERTLISAIWDNCSIEHSYQKNISPYDWTSVNVGVEMGVGIISPHIENELIGNPFSDRFSTDGTYRKIYIPEIVPGEVTYHQNSLLEYIYLFDGTSYFYKEEGQVYFGPGGTNILDALDPGNSDTSSPGFNEVAGDIARKMISSTNITFHVGGAVKVYNSSSGEYEIYLCSTHTANIARSSGDFSIFLAWALYQTPIVTDDSKLIRDLEANGATVYSINN